MNDLDIIWHYSHFYGEMISTSMTLHESNESYAALLVLFNSMELICKSVRENDKQNFIQDLEYLRKQNILEQGDYEFLNSDKSCVRKVRNLMMHKDVYQYCFEDNNGIAYPFSVKETWSFLYDNISERIIGILSIVISKSSNIIG